MASISSQKKLHSNFAEILIFLLLSDILEKRAIYNLGVDKTYIQIKNIMIIIVYTGYKFIRENGNPVKWT